MSAPHTPAFEIEKLRRKHDVSQFDCGNATLNIWLQKYERTNQQADSAKTYVALAGNRVVGYYSLTTGSVHKHESPDRIAKGLANHPIGIVLLARLAVDTTQQGRGLWQSASIRCLDANRRGRGHRRGEGWCTPLMRRL